jgi:hypothetical protein
MKWPKLHWPVDIFDVRPSFPPPPTPPRGYYKALWLEEASIAVLRAGGDPHNPHTATALSIMYDDLQRESRLRYVGSDELKPKETSQWTDLLS